MIENFDLFGNPIDPDTGRPGRPRKVATVADRSKVRMLLAVGWSNERIASVMHMSLPTFRKVFFQELKVRLAARDMMDARLLEVAMNAAVGGNVGAMRQVERLLDRLDRAGAERQMGERSAVPTETRPPKVGKKLMAESLALDADAALADELEQETRHVRH